MMEKLIQTLQRGQVGDMPATQTATKRGSPLDAIWQRLKRLASGLPREQAWLFPAPWAWAMLAGLALVAAVWFEFSAMEFVIDADIRTTGLTVLILLGAGLLNARRGSTWLAALLQALGFFIVAGVLGRALNYLVTGLNLPYQDRLLDSFHDIIGFDWQAHVLWLNEQPYLMRLLEFAYASYAWLIPFTIIALAVAGRFARLREFLLLFALTGFACMIIGGLLPAQGTYGYYGLSPAGLENIPPTGTSYLSDLEAVRAGALRDFIVGEATGLTQFPSFHAVMALLFAWAWRGTLLQWPMLALSGLTMLATPVMGGHYLIDLAGGALVFATVLRVLHALGAADAHGRWHWPSISGRRGRGGNLVSTISGEMADG